MDVDVGGGWCEDEAEAGAEFRDPMAHLKQPRRTIIFEMLLSYYPATGSGDFSLVS